VLCGEGVESGDSASARPLKLRFLRIDAITNAAHEGSREQPRHRQRGRDDAAARGTVETQDGRRLAWRTSGSHSTGRQRKQAGAEQGQQAARHGPCGGRAPRSGMLCGWAKVPAATAVCRRSGVVDGAHARQRAGGGGAGAATGQRPGCAARGTHASRPACCCCASETRPASQRQHSLRRDGARAAPHSKHCRTAPAACCSHEPRHRSERHTVARTQPSPPAGRAAETSAGPAHMQHLQSQRQAMLLHVVRAEEWRPGCGEGQEQQRSHAGAADSAARARPC
jgi:hypothetical protein